jgi:two-component system cell cycle sensor histidine kinase/response regulator CckA
MSDPPFLAAIGGYRQPGRLRLVLAVCAFLAGSAASLAVLPKTLAVLAACGLLALLAATGVFALLALASGLLQFRAAPRKADVTRLICDENPDAILITDADGTVTYANKACLRLSNLDDWRQLRGAPQLFQGTAEESEAMYRLAQAARSGNVRVEEIRAGGRGGEKDRGTCYKVAVRPLSAEGPRSVSLWTLADVTAERARQENIFQVLQHAIDFLDQAPAGFFSCDRHGSVSYMNATLANWLDYDLAEVGTGGIDLPVILAQAPTSLLSPAAGAAGELRTIQLDLDLKRRGGQNFPARLLHRIAFGLDGTPGPSHTLVLRRPVGEAPAETSRVGEARFARIFNSTPMAIAIIDGRGQIAKSNAAFAKLMPGALNAPDASTCPLYVAILDRDRPALEAALEAVARARTAIPPIDVGLTGQGERSARLYLSALEESDGTGMVIYALETTEQRELQNNFAQAVKMNAIGQLAGNVAHDFNNLLTAIIGHADLLLASHRPTDPAFRDILEIKHNSNRAASLVRQLLAYSRRQTLRPQILQLGDVLSDLQFLMRRLVGENIDLDLRHGRDLWLVRADLNQFEQVMINLIVNARDAMPGGGKILLRTRNVTAAECVSFKDASLVASDYVAIEVEDFGHGIPPDVKDKIFEPFFTTKEIGKGTGLGLAMVYGIVKQTGGYIFCTSTPGEGTTFTILLPRHAAEEPGRVVGPEAATKVQAADLTGCGTILLVEDEEAVRAFGARALASRGYTVLQATTGVEALEVVDANEGRIDLVVSDVVMPEMDGPTLLGELRKRGIKAKVIFVSGYAEDAFERNLPEGEDFGFLPKPFSIKQLVEAVKGCLT